MVSYSITIKKFNPQIDDGPWYQTYCMEYAEPPTILSALKDIREIKDEKLAFRESCGFGKCGSCAIRQNGEAVLACRTLLKEHALLEPLENYPVIRDLVVDRKEYDTELVHLQAHIQRADYLKKDKEPFQWSNAYGDNAACIGCLVCQSECPAYGLNPSEFPGPATLMQLAKMLHHRLDRGERAKTVQSAGIHNCTACMRCEHSCPKGLHPFRQGVTELRMAIEKEGLEIPVSQSSLTDQYAKNGSVVGGALKVPKHACIKEGTDSLLYLGCMYANRYPEMTNTILDILEKLGLCVSIPENLHCCGGPLLWVGDKEHASEAIIHNINIFLKSGAKRIIVPCPGCAVTFKEDYIPVYEENYGEKFPLEIIDFSTLISQIYRGDNVVQSQKIKAIYHAPCHHGKAQGYTGNAIALLEKCQHIDLVGSKILDQCCGGMVASANPAAAVAHSQEIVIKALQEDAELIITNCIFCKDNLARAIRRMGETRIKVKCLTEMI